MGTKMNRIRGRIWKRRERGGESKIHLVKNRQKQTEKQRGKNKYGNTNAQKEKRMN